MNEFNPERTKPWNVYTSSDPTQSQTAGAIERDAPRKNFGNSMNAISFGFVATAVLISMFLIMAVFEHLFRPSFSSTQDMITGSLESSSSDKLGRLQTVPTSYASDFSVVMPGQQYPTFIAKPAPLACQREGIHWPSHEHSIVLA